MMEHKTKERVRFGGIQTLPVLKGHEEANKRFLRTTNKGEDQSKETSSLTQLSFILELRQYTFRVHLVGGPGK